MVGYKFEIEVKTIYFYMIRIQGITDIRILLDCSLEVIQRALKDYLDRILKNINCKKIIRKNNILKSVKKEFSYDMFLECRDVVNNNLRLPTFSKNTIKEFIKNSNSKINNFTKGGFNAIRDVLVKITETILIKSQRFAHTFHSEPIISELVVEQVL